MSVAALAFASWSSSGVAAVPNGITQQGRVLDSDGNPLTSEVAMTFTIYDDPTKAADKNVLWTQVLNIQLDDGYFSARLGEDGDNAFPATLFDGSVRYLGIKIGTDDELAPRARLASVPYAFVAGDVNGDINPLSVSVAGKTVIDNKGNWVGNAVDRPLSSLLSIVKGVETQTVPVPLGAGAVREVSATCPTNQFVTGGGCTAAASDDNSDNVYNAALKESYPAITAGAPAPNSWVCACWGNNGDTCKVIPYAVCQKN